MRLWPGRLRNQSLRNQLSVAVSVGIVCLALISSLTLSWFASRAERVSLMTQGEELVANLARQSTLAVLYDSAENVEEALAATQAFPNVSATSVHDLTGRTIAFGGERRALESTLDTPVLSGRVMLEHETDRYWIFQAPVYSLGVAGDEEISPFEVAGPEQEQVGYVRLALSKAPLQQAVLGILAVNISISLLLAGLLVLALRAITDRLGAPLRDLADIMRRSESGVSGLRAGSRGPSDVTDMAHAFNLMMDVLEDREQQLTRARDAALEMARIKSEFAASVSHELRTPLNGVIGMLDLLEQHRLPPRQAEYLRVARNSATNLMSLINDILDFSKVEAGKLEFDENAFGLREMLEEVNELMSGQAHKKGLELGYVLSPEVPEMLHGKRLALHQVVTNLVANAVKFTEQGEVAVSVELLEEDDEFVTLYFRVTDTGIGISPEDRERIFDSFAQADGAGGRRHGGTGLGLAITRRLVDAMGGEIGVESEPGSGSTFWFVSGFSRLSGEQERRADAVDARSLAGMRVLTVQAFGVVGRFLQTTLGSWGVDHAAAADPHQALRVLRDAARRGREFDVVLVDIVVPGMPVSEFVHHIKADAAIASARVIVMLPAHGPVPATLSGHGGISGWLAKPLTAQLLRQNLAGGLESSQVPAVGEHDANPASLDGHVLLVEDNRTNQQVAEGMLRSLGCRVTIAENGEDALRHFDSERYDAILMDCNMPVLDGYEATARIRETEAADERLPIIALTANALEGDSRRCLEAGMDDYLAKPLSLRDLRAHLERWLPAPGTRSVVAGQVTEAAGSYAWSETVNQRTLANLRSAIGNRLPAMVTAFLEDADQHLDTLATALAENDPAALTASAHALKGGCRNLGLDCLGDMARGFEDLAKSGATAEGQSLLQEARAEFARVREALAEEMVRSAPAGQGAAEADQTPMVLVVDDDRGTRLALRHALEQDGYRVMEAGDGEQAVAVCQRDIPDVVLMDALMPGGGNGFETCREMRARPALEHTPVLIITALENEDSVERAFAAGASDFIPKPINFALLRQRVGRMVHAGRNARRVQELALHDPLTGLANRHLFREQVEQLAVLASEKETAMAVMALDLDRFKNINDSLGHGAGDILLKALAERLTRCLRGGDSVAHLGGDEFGVVLYGLAYPGVAGRVADKIRAAMTEPFMIQEHEVFCRLSIGIAIHGEHGTSATELMKHADVAMYQAKRQGNTWRFFEAGMGVDARRRLVLEKDIRKSLANGDFLVHYQPQIDLAGDVLRGAEALVRWEHPEHGMVMPLEFISLAEDTGLIEEIEQQVLQTACEQQVLWREAGFAEHTVAVNLSGRRMLQTDLVESVAGVLEDTGVDPAMVCMEITETVLMAHSSRNRQTLSRLREMGLKLAMDDFGTGYSSLSYLKNLPIDALKIDRSFVRDVCTDEYDAAMLSGIIKLVHDLGLTVVAEGVETEEQRAFLRRHGCDAMQGFLISKPLPAAEYESTVLRGEAFGNTGGKRVVPINRGGRP